MRIFIPGTAKSKKTGSREGSHADGSQAGSDAEDEAEEQSAAQVFHDLIKEKAEIGKVTGEGLVTLPEVLCLTPR